MAPIESFFGRRVIPAAVAIMLFAFVSAMTVFLRKNTHFVADDFDHFSDVMEKSFFDVLMTPIDVHFVPLHKFASFLIFTWAQLDFDAALCAMVAGWVASVFFLHRILLRLIPLRAALLITLLIGASPAWLHTLIWWSSAAHRIPYLALQAAAILGYLRFRDRLHRRDGILCAAMQLLALGFYVKAILLPLFLAGIELCLAIQGRRLSRGGLKLIFSMGLISALYVSWYLFFSPVMRAPMDLGVVGTVSGAIKLLLRLGAQLLFMPVEQPWSLWGAAVFWVALVGLCIWRKSISPIPVAILILLLLISYVLTVSGRGGLIVEYPLAVMRYSVDELILIAVFAALAMKGVSGGPALASGLLQRRCGLFLVGILLVGYPILSYYYDRAFFVKFYSGHKRTHDFMVNLTRSLSDRSSSPEQSIILAADFPGFAYGFLGSKKPMAEIFSHAYPKIRWLSVPGQVRGDVFQVLNDGRLGLAYLPDSPDFRDSISFPGWSVAESSHRWSQGKRATILFSLRPGQEYEGLLLVRGPVLGVQRVAVRLNDTPIANVRLGANVDCCSWSIKFDAALLRADGLNAFEFELPDARQPGNGDERVLAIGVQTVKIR